MKKAKFSDLEERADLTGSDVFLSSVSRGGLIHMIGNKQLTFEGKYKILEYGDVSLKFKGGKQTIVISGDRIKVSNITSDSFTVTGSFSELSFE